VPKALLDRLDRVMELAKEVVDHYGENVGVVPKGRVKIEVWADETPAHYGRQASWSPRATHQKIRVHATAGLRETWMALPERFYRELDKPERVRKAAGGSWRSVVAKYDALSPDDLAVLTLAHSAAHLMIARATTRLWLHEAVSLRTGFHVASALGVPNVAVIAEGLKAGAELDAKFGLFEMKSYGQLVDADDPHREGISFHGRALRLMERIEAASHDDASEELLRALSRRHSRIRANTKSQDRYLYRLVKRRLGSNAARVLVEAGLEV
jgi:hypothetical protein